jgi:hypothetical protein
MTKTGKTVLLVVLGLIVCVGMVGVVGAVWFFTSVLETVTADEAEAGRSFTDVRARFGESLPLLEMGDRGPVLKRKPPEAPAGHNLKNIQVIAWDPGDEELVRVTLPFWLMRLSDGPINVSAESAVPGVRLSMTVEELERFGPALLIDHMEEDGSRILIWTE